MQLEKSNYSSREEVTPKQVYLSRRKFLAAAGIAGAAALAGGEVWKLGRPSPATADPGAKLSFVAGPYSTSEKVTPENDVTHYNNFYEFGAAKADPAKYAENFVTSPWTVSVEGEKAAKLFNGRNRKADYPRRANELRTHDGDLKSILTSKWTKPLAFLLCLVPFIPRHRQILHVGADLVGPSQAAIHHRRFQWLCAAHSAGVNFHGRFDPMAGRERLANAASAHLPDGRCRRDPLLLAGEIGQAEPPCVCCHLRPAFRLAGRQSAPH